MLAVILKILGIIGMILLILLAVFITVVLLVLFYPVKFRIRGSKSGEVINADIKLKWLFGFISAGYRYPSYGQFYVKLFGIRLLPKKKRMKEEKANDKNAQDESTTSKKIIAEIPKQAADEKENAEDAVSEETEVKKSLRAKILEKCENIKYTIQQFCGKIKHIWENISFYKELLFHEDTKELIKHIFRRVFDILKKVKPKRIKADILFGTGEPDTTGYVLGVYGILSSKIQKPNYVNLTPDFENKIFEGNVQAYGSVRLFGLLKNVLMLLLDKRLKELLTKLKEHKARKDDNNGR